MGPRRSYDPKQKPTKKGMIVKQYLDGKWLTLIEIPSEVPEADIVQEDVDKAMKELRDIVFHAEKVQVYYENQTVIFNRLDGPVKLIWGDIVE